MKMSRLVVLIGMVSLVVLSFSSCKKIRQDNLINGLWKVNSIYVDTQTTNFMRQLPHYTEGNGCCIYKIDFQRDDVVFGYYLTHDTFNYVVVGNWYLNRFDEIYINFDQYFDGNFEIAKPTPKNFVLTSDKNHIRAFDIVNPQLDTTYTKIKLERI